MALHGRAFPMVPLTERIRQLRFTLHIKFSIASIAAAACVANFTGFYRRSRRGLIAIRDLGQRSRWGCWVWPNCRSDSFTTRNKRERFERARRKCQRHRHAPDNCCFTARPRAPLGVTMYRFVRLRPKASAHVGAAGPLPNGVPKRPAGTTEARQCQACCPSNVSKSFDTRRGQVLMFGPPLFSRIISRPCRNRFLAAGGANCAQKGKIPDPSRAPANGYDGPLPLPGGAGIYQVLAAAG